MCLWTPGAFVAAGLALGALWQWIADAVEQKGWHIADWKRLGWALAAVVAVVLLLSRWWWTVLGPCHNVVDYVGTPMPRPALSLILWNGAKRLFVGLLEGHPVIIFLGLAGLCAAPKKGLFRWLFPLALILAAIAGWSKELKPLSQLERMEIPLVVALILPTAFAIDELIGTGLDKARKTADAAPLWPIRRATWSTLAIWLACGFVIATLVRGAQTIRDHYANRNFAPQRTWENSGMPAIAAWIATNVPPAGRLAFAGKAVHAFGGGNTAYLPVLTHREMMGDDYYGFPRGTIEYNYPPRAYRADGIPGYVEWSRLHGITHWIATRQEDVRRLDSAPDAFRPVATFTIKPPPFPPPRPAYTATIYEVVAARETGFGLWSSRAIDHPEIAVDAAPSHIAVDIPDAAEPPASFILRYNWREGLYADDGAEIAPSPMDENVTFISVRPAPGSRHVDIRYKTHSAPIQPNFDGRFHH